MAKENEKEKISSLTTTNALFFFRHTVPNKYFKIELYFADILTVKIARFTTTGSTLQPRNRLSMPCDWRLSTLKFGITCRVQIETEALL